MKDFLPVYFSWLTLIKEDSSSWMFRLWLYTLTDSQLDEVSKKTANGSADLLDIINPDSVKQEFMDVKFECKQIQVYRAEAALLIHAHMSAPIDDIEYFKMIMATTFDKELWRKASDAHLELALKFYNHMDHRDPFHDKEIAYFCSEVIAERQLLGI